MKSIGTNLQLAAILAAATFAHAQTMTVYNDPSDPNVTTVYYSVCPTAVEMTVTLASTLTYCPGPNCHGGAMITPAPGAGGHHDGGSKPPGSEIIAYTTTGKDGKITEYHEYVTVYDQVCSTGGLEHATYTITEQCPCTATPNPMTVPHGFTTTVMACDTCGRNGEPGTVTLTTPCSTGPYATVMPSVGPTGSWSGAGGSSDGGSSGGNAGPGALNQPNMPAGSQSGGVGSSNTVESWSPAGSGISNAPKAGSGTASGPIATYTGAAVEQLSITISVVFAVALGGIAWML